MRGEKQAGKARTRTSVAASPLQAMDPNLARVAPESLQSLLQASHADPFALLGAHPVAGGMALRTLLPGAQDRLSWMVQLAAIAAADPARGAAGDRVVLPVSGARGDADAWVFVAGDAEPVDLPGQRVEQAQVWRRAPRKPYDTQVEVWLDPARHFMPVRLKLSTPGSTDSLEFVLKP